MNVPNHIAIILDGNGRWAKAKGMPRSYGHVKGCANLETVCDYMKELGVKYVTVYAFSTENWKRSKDEVDGLMKLFRSYLKKCIKLADKNKMRVRVIGEVSAFDQDIQESIARLEQYSQKYDEIYFQIALNYGSMVLNSLEIFKYDCPAASFSNISTTYGAVKGSGTVVDFPFSSLALLYP